MANEQTKQAQPQTADQPASEQRFDEFDGQPVYLVGGKRVDPNGQPVKDAK